MRIARAMVMSKIVVCLGISIGTVITNCASSIAIWKSCTAIRYSPCGSSCRAQSPSKSPWIRPWQKASSRAGYCTAQAFAVLSGGDNAVGRVDQTCRIDGGKTP
jgi:hypothetical protein